MKRADPGKAGGSPRVPLIDEIRGAAILLMVLYHGGYNLVAIFGVDMPFFFSSQLNLARDIMAGAFIFISGCSCRFSHSNLRRGLITLGWAMALTAGTALVIPDQVILFGVLHCLGVCMLLYLPLRPLLDRLSPTLGALLCGVLFYLTFTVPRGFFGGITYGFRIPRALYDAGFLFPLGFASPQFFSSDYYPLLPWLFLFLCGACLGVLLKEGRFPPFFYRGHSRFFAFVGRHTLVIYMVHQPIIYGVMSVLFWYIGQ